MKDQNTDTEKVELETPLGPLSIGKMVTAADALQKVALQVNQGGEATGLNTVKDMGFNCHDAESWKQEIALGNVGIDLILDRFRSTYGLTSLSSSSDPNVLHIQHIKFIAFKSVFAVSGGNDDEWFVG